MSAAAFYALAAAVVACTALAVTRRDLVHAAVYLIGSFLGTALLFYLLGAPFLAAAEGIIYAGAIMVVFLFVVMTGRADQRERPERAPSSWLPALAIGGIYAGALGLLAVEDPAARECLTAGVAAPAAYGSYVFTRHGLAVEAISLLLLVALVGALHLGRQRPVGRGRGEGPP